VQELMDKPVRPTLKSERDTLLALAVLGMIPLIGIFALRHTRISRPIHHHHHARIHPIETSTPVDIPRGL